MQTEIIVALAAAASALLVSVTTAVAQFLQIRARDNLDKAQRRDQQIDEALITRFQEVRTALREGCKALQRVQDEMLLLIKTADSVGSKTQHERLIRARNHLLSVYREYHSVLDSTDRQTLDEARKKVVNIILGLELRGLWSPTELSITDDVRRELETANMLIANDHQQLLLSALDTVDSKLTVRRNS